MFRFTHLSDKFSLAGRTFSTQKGQFPLHVAAEYIEKLQFAYTWHSFDGSFGMRHGIAWRADEVCSIEKVSCFNSRSSMRNLRVLAFGFKTTCFIVLAIHDNLFIALLRAIKSVPHELPSGLIPVQLVPTINGGSASTSSAFRPYLCK